MAACAELAEDPDLEKDEVLQETEEDWEEFRKTC
jgi:hypothetical protein